MASRSFQAFSLFEVMVLAVAIGMIAAVSVPHYAHARTRKLENVCVDNLVKIDEAKQEWALDYRVTISARPDYHGLRPYLPRSRKDGALPFCPLDQSNLFETSYAINKLTVAPACKQDSTNHFLN